MFPHDSEDRPVTGDQPVAAEIAWCPGCRADCPMEIVVLPDAPGPVAVCADCGLGVETWWSPELLVRAPELLSAARLGGVRAS